MSPIDSEHPFVQWLQLQAATVREEVQKLPLLDKLLMVESIHKLRLEQNENHAFLQHYRRPLQVRKRHGKSIKGELLFKIEIGLR